MTKVEYKNKKTGETSSTMPKNTKDYDVIYTKIIEPCRSKSKNFRK